MSSSRILKKFLLAVASMTLFPNNARVGKLPRVLRNDQILALLSNDDEEEGTVNDTPSEGEIEEREQDIHNSDSEQELDSRFEEEELSCEEVESSENFRPKSTVSKDPHDISDREMIDIIVTFTNQRITKAQEDGTFSRERDAKPTEANEILAVIGMLLLIGLKKQSRTNTLDLWDPFDGQFSLRACMGINRFLLRFLRFDDSETRIQRKIQDKLAPSRTIFDTFRKKCLKTYSLGEFVTIDEQLQGFRGRCSFIQYNPKKPAKYGIKFFALCDAKPFYTSDVEIYCGKQPAGPFQGHWYFFASSIDSAHDTNIFRFLIFR
ncbi:PiggyBac transposable element-derived protein 4 [Eumeta japonica]|uniref:PiggyBac transposable element-derived protein 4 n=1 Tax=Eumeta variegata TaxID=151549 RepID=A0A4C1XL83_EUMVA|nr:PiggyBac transposable element-derived protein 4 [Eumeta japonica]